MIRIPLLGWLLAIPLVALSLSAAEVGEFPSRAVNPLNAMQIDRLRELISQDSEATALAEAIQSEATPLLDARPDPIAVIHYEGLVNTDPQRIETVAHLREMDDVALLTRHWQASGDPRAAETLRRFIAAWADTYKPTGNDVNENKLYPLLVAYSHLRDTFPEPERKAIDAWLRALGTLHEPAVRTSQHLTNRYTKHVRFLALLGRILDVPEWQAAADEGVKRFVAHSLRPDGTSLDLERRDTLTYHASALRPLIELAMLAGENGRTLYAWESESGGSIRKSVDYIVPYALGEKTRKEWVNTKVQLDRDRAAAGLEEYQPGRLYDPQDAFNVMEEASYFDPALTRVVFHLNQSDAKRFPTWQMLVNEAARTSKADSDATTGAGAAPLGDAAIDQRIDANRKIDIAFRVTDAQGQPVTGPATYKLIRHAFEFGTAIAAPMIGIPKEKDKEPVAPEDIAKYEAIVTKYFNAVVAENAMKWSVMDEPEGPREAKVRAAVRMEEWARERGLFLRGHTVFWGVSKWIPEWQRDLAKGPPAAIEARMKTRLRHILGLFDGKITEWDLNNEMMHEDIFGKGLGWENGAEYFKWAKEVAPDVTFYVNEFGVLQGNEIDRYVAHIRELLDAGAPVGGIGDQAHFFKPIPSDKALWAILDQLGQFGLPVKITEFDLGYRGMTPEAQAEGLRRFYRLCFAHPAVEGIYMWGFFEGSHWRPGTAPWKRDWTPTPAANAYIKLMEEDFMTAGRSDGNAGGELKFRGFPGKYRITSDAGTAEVVVSREHPAAEVTLIRSSQ